MSQSINWESVANERLRSSGWYLGRRIDTCVVKNRLKLKGFTWFPSAAHHLQMFGGLRVNVSKHENEVYKVNRDCLYMIGNFSPILCQPRRWCRTRNGDATFLLQVFGIAATIVGHVRSTTTRDSPHFSDMLSNRIYILEDGSFVSCLPEWEVLTRFPDFDNLLFWLLGSEQSTFAETITDQDESLNLQKVSLGLLDI